MKHKKHESMYNSLCVAAQTYWMQIKSHYVLQNYCACPTAKETLPRTEMPFWRTPVTDAEAAAHLHFVHNRVKEKTPAPPRRSRW